MIYCDHCVMPNTRPGINFTKDKEGKNICSACINHKNKENIDYKARFKELEALCDKYRRMNGKFEYDCAIAVSGGKDSHFQVHIMKEKLGMNPILFSVEDNFTMTEFIDRLIYSYPFAMALKFNTPLLVYGENVSYEYGGSDDKETPSAKEIFLNGTASDLDINEFIDNEIKEENLQLFFNPNANDINKLNPIYLSYFVKWNSYSNYIFAKSRGFTDLEGEWDRTMCAENFDQVDSIGYILHAWMKYPKFGHACASDYAARFVRYGLLSRKEAIELVQKRDRKLDNRCVEDFCNFIGISKTTFWKIVEKHYNMDLFYKNDFGEFKLKNKLQ
ncbi:N-acetyl sugar amidotransferase [Campylobacter jejuni]|nr:N-acetyl sugar amidotransferase [Campylobacter jejuni]